MRNYVVNIMNRKGKDEFVLIPAESREDAIAWVLLNVSLRKVWSAELQK